MIDWSITESRQVRKILRTLPPQVLEKYGLWRQTVLNEGPTALRRSPGWNDEALQGVWEGYRSSRLNLQWRVIYIIQTEQVNVHVERITPHDYRR